MLTTPTALAISLALTFGVAEPIGPYPASRTPSSQVVSAHGDFAVTKAQPDSVRGVFTPIAILDITPEHALPGVTRPARDATLGVPFDGMIADLPAHEGARVRKGDVIAVLDDRVARQAKRISEIDATHNAGVIRAEAVFERAADALRRAETAYKAGAMNDEQIEEARNRQDIAAADLQFAQEIFDKAQAQLTLTRAQFEEHTIRAPFDGIVVRVHAEAGEVLSPGEPLADLLALDRTMVDLHLPAESALGLRAGDRVALDIAEPIGAVTAARVVYAEPRVDATSKTTRVVFEFEPTPFIIPAGVLVTPGDRLPEASDTDRFVALAERAGHRFPIAAAE